MKTILLFGAGKSATVLIDYLIAGAENNNWKIIIADVNREQILAKTNHHPATEAISLDINNSIERKALVEKATIVISMMPPALHVIVAEDCLEFSKDLLTASYVDEKLKDRSAEIESKGLLFLCEMGLDPGIDHMSAMKMIDDIKSKGGTVTSFKSHCGGLIAPESDNNPWHYKISWNPRNIVLAGKSGAVYKDENVVREISYRQIFSDSSVINIDGLKPLATYPNRDSLSYIPLYHLEDASTFIRTTLRYPVFCKAWNLIARTNLTSENSIDVSGLTYKKWSAPIADFVTEENRSLFSFLGFFEETNVPSAAGSSADILQYLLETKLVMEPQDKDMIVMLHEIEYIINGKRFAIKSSLIVKGEDSLRTAMAKTVGLPLGIAAKLILDGKIKETGLRIPIDKEIYEPVLEELALNGIRFQEDIC
ncbi:MAG: saccharopine dehydrogenase C-terminal domain-containing protein [Ferruginibacter sp.]